MRTTIDIEDALLAKIKKRATALKLSVSEYLALAAVEHLNRSKESTAHVPPFELIEAGEAGAAPKVSWSEITHSASDIVDGFRT